MKQVGLSDTNAIRRSKIHKRTISSQWGSGLHFAFYLVHCKSLIHGKSHATPLPVPVADKAKCERKTSLFKAPCNQRKEVLGRKPEFLRASLPKTVANISTRHHGHHWARLFILLPGKRTPVSKVAYLSQFPLHAKLKFPITQSAALNLITRLRITKVSWHPALLLAPLQLITSRMQHMFCLSLRTALRAA